MHIGQFSLVICSFVLAVAGYFIWPHEPSLLPAISILSIAAVSFIASRYIALQHCRRVGLVLLAVLIGFAWAQMRSHMQAQNGKAPIGELQIYESVEWHEAPARLTSCHWRRWVLVSFVCLTAWRLFGLLPIALALTGIGQGERPALHMFGRELIAARTDDALLVLRQRGHQYELDRLARHHGLVPKEISCRPHCRLTLKGGIEFAYHDRLGGLTQSCRSADVIVMPFAEARYSCRAQLFDSRAFAKRVHRQFTSKKGKLQRQALTKNRLWQRD